MNDNADNDPRLYAIPDIHGHAKGEHKAFTDERPIPLSARMLFLWFYHACRRGWPRFLMVTDHMNYLTFEDPAAINLVRRALKLAQAGDLYGAAETASVEVGHAAVVSEGLRRGMRYSLGAEVDNDPRCRPDAQNIVDAMKPDGMIRSVHFLTIDHPTYGPNWNWPFDNPEFSAVFETIGTAKTWELYMATLLDAVERLPGNIVGHFYVPALFGHWPDDATLESYEDQIVDACEARGMAIELNTRFLYRNHSDEERARYLTAHRRLLAKCKAKNVGVAVGSDAHSPKDQGRAFPTVLALLDECEINELVFPIAGRLARVALRVDRKSDAPPATDPAAGSAPVEDRKTVRKARTSEVPARSKDSSSKRDDAPASDASSDDAPPKTKPRPKRSKSRSASAGDDAAGTPTGEIADPHLSPIDALEADSALAAHVESAGFGVTEPALAEHADRAQGESSFAQTLDESGATGASDSALTDVSAAHSATPTAGQIAESAMAEAALTMAVGDELVATKSDGGLAINGAATDRSTTERVLDEENPSREPGSYGFDGLVVAQSPVAQGNASLATAAPAQASTDGMRLRRLGAEESLAAFTTRDRDDAGGEGSWANVSGTSSGDAVSAPAGTGEKAAAQTTASDTALRPDAIEAQRLPNGKSETVLDAAAPSVAIHHRADLDEAVLEAADLEAADLDEADLDEVALDAADVDEAVLDEAELDEAVLDEADLDEAVLDEADLDEAVLDDAVLDAAVLATAVIDEADLDEVLLDEGDLDEVVLDEANLADVVLGKADLDGAVIDAAAVLDKADLEATIIDEADLDAAVIDEADLDAAVIDEADLDAAAVDEADLNAAPDETPLHDQMTSNAALRVANGSNKDGMSDDAADEIAATIEASEKPAEREDTLLVLEETPGEAVVEVLKPDTVSSVVARARILTGGSKSRARTASGKTKASVKVNGLKKSATKPAAKTAAKRVAAPKAAAKKAVAKSGAVKAAPAKKTAAKKTAAKKVPNRPAAAKKTAAKKAASKQPAAKKTGAKKPSQKRR